MNNTDKQHENDRNSCPDCGTELVKTGRCSYCPSCGWSACEVD